MKKKEGEGEREEATADGVRHTSTHTRVEGWAFIIPAASSSLNFVVVVVHCGDEDR